MKNYQIISLDEQVDSDYDEELEKELDNLRQQKANEEKIALRNKQTTEIMQELERLQRLKKSIKLTPTKTSSFPRNLQNFTGLVQVDYKVTHSDSNITESGSKNHLKNPKSQLKLPSISKNSSNEKENLVNELTKKRTIAEKFKEINKGQDNSNENFKTQGQGDLIFQNIKLADGVVYTDKNGNKKGNTFSLRKSQPNINSFEKPFRLSRSEYNEIIKNKGNFSRKRYLNEEEHSSHPKKESYMNHFSPKNKNIEIIDEKSFVQENESLHQNGYETGHQERMNESLKEIKTIVKDLSNNDKRPAYSNQKAKKNNNIVHINNPLYLRLLVD